MGVTLPPNLTPNLGSFLLLKKSPFYSQSRVKITQSKQGLLWELCKDNFSLFPSQFFSQGSGKDKKDFFDLQKGTNTFCLKEPGKLDHNHYEV